MLIENFRKKKLPESSGVYIFKSGMKVLYIGKATSLRSRVRSYFASGISNVRSPLIEKMVLEAKSLDIIETDSVLEALILEANLIKKYKPIFNSKEKDDKSFNYVLFTDETFPRLLSIRGKNLKNQLQKTKAKYLFGPFPHGGQFKEAMKIIRKIFPYFDTKYPIEEEFINKKTSSKSKQIKFNQSIGIFPGKPGGDINKKEYSKSIRHLRLFFEGKKKALLSSLEKEMKDFAKKGEFEKASIIKKKIFAIIHIHDISLIKEEYKTPQKDKVFRIEAYDIAHMSGRNVIGVMSVVECGEINKGEYRKFKISKEANNDTAALKEVLSRRFAHNEWQYPNLIVVDGGKAQLNTANRTLSSFGYSIPIVGVVKDEHHNPKGFVGDKKLSVDFEREILLANSEAHRFAISYYRKLSRKSLKIK